MAARPRKEKKLLGFQKRLSELVGDTPYSVFETKCGLGRMSVHDMLAGRSPSRERLEAVIKGTGCNARWLVTGEGEPFGDEKTPPATAGGHKPLTRQEESELLANASMLQQSLALCLLAAQRHSIPPAEIAAAIRQAALALAQAIESLPQAADVPLVPPQSQNA